MADTCLVDDCLNPQSPLCMYCEHHHLKLCGQLHHRLRQLPPSALLDCKLGEPLMHGPQPYEWCVTHQRLMMTCRASAPPSALLTEEQLAEYQRECDLGVADGDVEVLLAHIRELQRQLDEAQDYAAACDDQSGKRGNEVIKLGREVVNLREQVQQLQQRLNQTIADDCETDTRCRELLKQWDKSDSYGVEPLEVVIERALKDLRR